MKNSAKIFTCSECGKDFTRADNFKTHLKIHTNRERPFNCRQCEKSFLKSNHLKDHQKTHSNENPYSCSFTDICDMKFKLKGNLKQHERIHRGEKPFNCFMCDKTFATSSHLKRHELTHTGEKPFHCSNCNKQFTQAVNLRAHEKRFHKGNVKKETFDCPKCGKICKTPGALYQHSKTHTVTEESLKCKVCDKRFSRKANLNKHHREKHSNKPMLLAELSHIDQVTNQKEKKQPIKSKIKKKITSDDFKVGRNNGNFLKRNAAGGKSITKSGGNLNQNTSQIEQMTDQFFSSLSLWNTYS